MLTSLPVTSVIRNSELDSSGDERSFRLNERFSNDQARVDDGRNMEDEANEPLEDPDCYCSVDPVDHDGSVYNGKAGRQSLFPF